MNKTTKKGRPKGSKNEGSLLERMAKKLDDTSYVERFRNRIHAWETAEQNEGFKQNLTDIAETLGEIESRRKEARDALLSLIDTNYEPPMTKAGSGLNYEPGNQVWIKPNKLEEYAVLYDKDQLSSFYIDQVHDHRVAVRIGKDGASFYIPKLHLTTRNPEAQETEA